MQIDAHTRIYAIIGNPINHSFSPAMYNAAFKNEKYNAVYVAFPIKNLTGLKHCLKKLNIRGISVTIPYKVKIRRILDEIDPLALRIGSVNTVKCNKNNLLKGYNTDGAGAIQSIQESGFDLRGKKILIIGSGGAARAICFSLLENDISQIGILSRNKSTSDQLARSLKIDKNNVKIEKLLFPSPEHNKKRWKKNFQQLKYPAQLEPYDMIINTTSIGMKGYAENKSPLSSDFLFKHQCIFDIVYNPQNTRLISMAQKKKIKYILGYNMLLFQGALQFKILTGKKAPVETMRKALKKQLL